VENQPNSFCTVYQRLFSRCPSLCFPGLWIFVGSSGDCRGCVVDPPETLAALRAEFELPLLQAAGVIDRLPDGNVCLHPQLCDPAGAIIALRAEGAEAPFELLTAAGCLSRRTLPLLATLGDARTAQEAQQTGYLLASFQIQEVALLRALGFPATLCTGLDNLSFDQLGSLDEVFGQREFSALMERGRSTEPATGEGSAESASAGANTPNVTLLGWSLLQLDPAAPIELSKTAAAFDEFGRFLDYDYSWLGIWRASSADVETLRYRLRVQALPLIMPLLEKSADTVYELCPEKAQVRLAEPEALRPPAHFAQAQADLVANLAGSWVDGSQEREVREAKRVYEEIVRRDLVRPLQEWALASADPVIRNTGAELASLCALLHEISPSLQAVVGDQLRYARGLDGDSGGKLLARYLQVSARFARLVKTLWHLARSKGNTP
jgi:hypothetical protein